MNAGLLIAMLAGALLCGGLAALVMRLFPAQHVALDDAFSRITPTTATSTPDNERVHSSSASSLAIRALAGAAVRRDGSPSAAIGATTTARTQCVTAHTTTPTASPAPARTQVRRVTRESGDVRLAGVRTPSGRGTYPHTMSLSQ